jgi:hypothetical protein
MSERTGNAALVQIRDSGGIVTSVVSVATALSPDFTTSQGKQMFEIVQTLRLASSDASLSLFPSPLKRDDSDVRGAGDSAGGCGDRA